MYSTAPKIHVRLEWIVLTAILCAAAFLRVYHLGFGIGSHPDERHMVSVTQQLSWADLNPHSFAYGSLTYYLNWLVSEAVSSYWPFLGSYDGLYYTGRAICVVLGLLTILLTYLLSVLAYGNKPVALISSALLAFNFLHIQLSRYFTSDIPLSFFCTLTLLAAYYSLRSKKSSAILLSAIPFGCAFATKISAMFLIAPILMVFLLNAARNRWSVWKGAQIALALFFLSAATFFLCAPYEILDFKTFSAHTLEQTNMVRGLWRPPYTIQYENTTPFLYPLEQIFSYTMGWPIALAVVGGIVYSVVTLVRKKAWEELILLSFLAALFLSTAGYMVKFPRYLLPLYPPLFVLAGRFLYALTLGSIPSLPLNNWQAKESFYKRGWISHLQSNTLFVYFLYGAALLSVLFLISAFSLGFSAILLVWMCSFTAPLLILGFREDKNSASSLAAPQWSLSEVVSITVVVLAAIGMRSVDLTNLPIQLHNDEMSCGLEARKFLASSPPSLFATGWLGHPNLGFFITSFFLRFFNDGLWGLRISSVVFGALSLIGSYLIVRVFFGIRVAFIGLILTSFYHFHLHFSRTGFHNMMALCLSVWAIAAFVYAVRNQRLVLYGVSGVVTAIACQTYNLAYVVPVLLAAWGGAQLLQMPSSRRQLGRGLLCWFFFLVLTSLPILAFFLQHPEAAASRARGVFVFAENNARHVAAGVGSSEILSILEYQITQMLRFFGDYRDTSLQYGFAGRFVDPFLLIPFILGLLYSAVRIARPGYQLFILWFSIVFIAGGVLTIDPPFAPRLLGMVTVIPTFAALFLSFLYEKFSKLSWRIAGSSLATICIIGSCSWNVEAYFSRYADTSPKEPRDYITRFLSAHPEVQIVVSSLHDQQNFSYESYSFMAPRIHGINLPKDEGSLAEISPLQVPAVIISPPEEAEGSPSQEANLADRGIFFDEKGHPLFRWKILRGGVGS